MTRRGPPEAQPDGAVTPRWHWRQVGVIRHKVTTLRPLVIAAASRTALEASMAHKDSATPDVQTAWAREKTFTRHLHDTLGSHLSCIGARGIPTTDGAADVSGR